MRATRRERGERRDGRRRRERHTALLVALALVATATGVAALAARASAEDRSFLERFSPDAEVFFVTNLESAGSDAFEPGLGGAMHVELNIIRSFGVHGGGALFVLTPGTLNETFYFGTQLGLRFHWTALLDLWGDGYVDAHWAFGVSEGGVSAHGFDAGLGYELELTPEIGLGPFVRFQWMADPGLSDPMFLYAGISMSFMASTRAGEPEPDEDLDGVADYDDVCPQMPIGRNADPDNRGCPARDRDGDGLVDPQDRCPSEAMWPHPNEDAPGCPLPDADADGVPDVNDVCPRIHAVDGGDPLREGCPEDDEAAGY